MLEHTLCLICMFCPEQFESEVALQVITGSEEIVAFLGKGVEVGVFVGVGVGIEGGGVDVRMPRIESACVDVFFR